MILTKHIKVLISVNPDKLDKNINKNVMERAEKILIGKALENIGIITSIVKKLSIVPGIIKPNGTIFFEVNVIIESYNPINSEEITATVKMVGMHGFYVEHGPLDEIFIATEKAPKVSVGDKVKVQITKVKYNKSKSSFTVLAKQIKKKKKVKL